MRSVRVRVLPDDFSPAMRAMGEWLDANGYLPTRYKYDHYDDAILVTVDFEAEGAAEAFAARFEVANQLHAQSEPPERPSAETGA